MYPRGEIRTELCVHELEFTVLDGEPADFERRRIRAFVVAAEAIEHPVPHAIRIAAEIALRFLDCDFGNDDMAAKSRPGPDGDAQPFRAGEWLFPAEAGRIFDGHAFEHGTRIA